MGKFFPQDIDPFLCTHIIYAFAKIELDHLEPFEWNDLSTDWSKGLLVFLQKHSNLNLRVFKIILKRNVRKNHRFKTD